MSHDKLPKSYIHMLWLNISRIESIAVFCFLSINGVIDYILNCKMGPVGNIGTNSWKNGTFMLIEATFSLCTFIPYYILSLNKKVGVGYILLRIELEL